MDQHSNYQATQTMGTGEALTILVFGFVFYVFLCFCLKKICEKCGVTPGILIWIPIVQLVPVLQAAQLPVWLIILFLIPCVNWIVGLVLWWKLCEARGKGVGAFLLIFFLPFIGIPYLAFAD